jgi:hypothetical protein
MKRMAPVYVRHRFESKTTRQELEIIGEKLKVSHFQLQYDLLPE